MDVENDLALRRASSRTRSHGSAVRSCPYRVGLLVDHRSQGVGVGVDDETTGRLQLLPQLQVLAGEIAQPARASRRKGVGGPQLGELLRGVRHGRVEHQRVGQLDTSADRDEPIEPGLVEIDIEAAALAGGADPLEREREIVALHRLVDEPLDLRLPDPSRHRTELAVDEARGSQTQRVGQ